MNTKQFIFAGLLGLSALNAIPANATQPNQSTTPAITPAKPNAAIKSQIAKNYGQLPLSFEANQGQSNSKEVKFLARGIGYNLALTPTEARLTLHSAKTAELRMQLVDANPTAQIQGAKELPGKINYITGNDASQWHTDIPTYERVQYQGVYPGVDMVYYGNQQQLEYDFVVAPGANPKAIALKFQGTDKLEIDRQGNLVLHAAGGKVQLHKPVVYQQINGKRQEIASNYILKEKNQVGFEVASYDTKQPLIIDPVLAYSNFLGGTATEDGFGIAADSQGNAYITGRTTSIDFPGRGNFGGGVSDAFVTKLDATGTQLIYSTYLGGNSTDRGAGIAVDAQGNAYITGDTSSRNFPLKNAFQNTLNGNATLSGGNDAFVTKLNATGGLVYSSYLGGDKVEFGKSIALDRDNNAYVTGQTLSDDFPTTPGVFDPNIGGITDTFVTKVNARGTQLVYSTYLGVRGSSGNGIAVDGQGNAHVTGIFPNPTFNDVLIVKLNATGTNVLYSKSLVGKGIDQGNSIALDSAGNAYVTGFTESPDFFTKNAFQSVLKGRQDAFVAKLSSVGSVLYSTYLGGAGLDRATGIAVDKTGNTYVTGITASIDFPIGNAFQPQFGGSSDAFIVKLNPATTATKQIVFSSFLGGSGFDIGQGIALDSVGNAYMTGTTSSSNFPIAVTAFQKKLAGSQDAFVAKIKP